MSNSEIQSPENTRELIKAVILTMQMMGFGNTSSIVDAESLIKYMCEKFDTRTAPKMIMSLKSMVNQAADDYKYLESYGFDMNDKNFIDNIVKKTSENK